MGVRTRITNNPSHKGFQTIYAYLESRISWHSPTDATPTNGNGTKFQYRASLLHIRAHPATMGSRHHICADAVCSSSDEGHDMLMTPP